MTRLNKESDLLKIQWILAFALVLIFGILLSFRQLSDPDLGFHLKYGKWIVENLTVPDHDLSTYTVPGNEYIDSHWLFQVLLYLTFKTTGYHGISILIAILAGTIFSLYLWRMRIFHFPPLLTLILFLSALILLEPRILPRPEMFTYVFLLLTLLILDSYYGGKKNLLFLLPFLLLAWSNIHGLCIIGLIVILAYAISCGTRKRTMDFRISSAFFFSVGACFLNPYFAKGFFFPFELLSRFNTNNIYHRHIAEFRSIFTLDHYTSVETTFIVIACVFLLIWISTIRKRPIHELILVPFSLYLSLVAVRNIPLLALICLPFIAQNLKRIPFISTLLVSDRIYQNRIVKGAKALLYVLLLIVPMAGIIRVINGSHYSSNRLNCRIGTGIDRFQLPEDASGFLIKNGLDGRILNSIGAGGWLSWRLDRPVFIDGRLEVMKEDLYTELMQSWDDGLSELVGKYQPSIIVCNYLKYYPWTSQLIRMPEWRLVYLDGLFAIYLRDGYANSIPPLTPGQSLVQFGLQYPDEPPDYKTFIPERINLLDRMLMWLTGNCQDSVTVLQNAGMFHLQSGSREAAEMLMVEVYRRTHGTSRIALSALRQLQKASPSLVLHNASDSEDKAHVVSNKEAVLNFNLGNQKLKQGYLKEAIACYSKSIQYNPGYYKAFLNRANAYATIKHYTEALADFDSAIAINPSHGEAYLGKGSCYYFIGMKEDACRYWQKASELGNRNAKQMMQQYCR